MTLYADIERLKASHGGIAGHSLHLYWSHIRRRWVIMERINDPAETNYHDIWTLTKEEARVAYRWKLIPVWFSSKDELWRLFVD